MGTTCSPQSSSPHYPLGRVGNQESLGSCKGQRSDGAFLPIPENFLLSNPTFASLMNTINTLEDPAPLSTAPHSMTLANGVTGPHATDFTPVCPQQAVESICVTVSHLGSRPLSLPLPFGPIRPSCQPRAHEVMGCVPLCLAKTAGPSQPGLRLIPHTSWRLSLKLLVLVGLAGGQSQNPLLLGPEIPSIPTWG